MAIESSCIPLPSEIIMPFAGYLVSVGKLDIMLVATAGAVGCNIGSTLAYAVGSRSGRRFIERWGRHLLISPRGLGLAQSFFRRYGPVTVLVGRLLPIVRTFIALPAGIARMPQLQFQAYTFIGSWVWCYALAYIGQKLGEKWNSDPRLRDLFHRFDMVIVFVLALTIGWCIWSHWTNRPRSSEK